MHHLELEHGFTEASYEIAYKESDWRASHFSTPSPEPDPAVDEFVRQFCSNTIPAPPQAGQILWCEFSELMNCCAIFRPDDEAGWIQHHVRHLKDSFPLHLMCWFCDHVMFDAEHTAEGFANFERRMQHIREHIFKDRLTSDDVRPDFHVITHLHRHGLLSDGMFKHAMSYQGTPERYRLLQETVEEEPSTIKCICNFTDDDGNTIYCETCDTWQHIECYYPDNIEDTCSPNFAHSCTECEPRSLNRQQAVGRQRSRTRRPVNVVSKQT
ncbi:SET domain-containing protein 3 [Madurella fahalii]|uniref:SET domain-containing protein 3 n=1 Tax=Madurella fahalii TaxID=1157608 RepID=A0ABQ0GTQ2_9PEZI